MAADHLGAMGHPSRIYDVTHPDVHVPRPLLYNGVIQKQDDC